MDHAEIIYELKLNLQKELGGEAGVTAEAVSWSGTDKLHRGSEPKSPGISPDPCAGGGADLLFGGFAVRLLLTILARGR